MSRHAGACPPSGPSRLEHVLAVGLRALSIGTKNESGTPESDLQRREPHVTPERTKESRQEADSKRRRLAGPKEDFKNATENAQTKEEICAAADSFMRWASRECRSGPISLELKSGTDLRLEECVGDTRKQFVHFEEKDYYLVLTFGEACTLSTLGIKRESAVEGAEPMFEKDYLEIFSNTVDSQTCKGYNTILRAVAVMIACIECMVLYSYNVNELNLSSYTLMRSYEFLANDERMPRGPLSQHEACAESKREKDDVGVIPSPENFKRAQEVVMTRVVACAEEERRRGAPGIPAPPARACPPCP